MEYTDITIRDPSNEDKKIWDTYAQHPLQTWAWGEFRKQQGTTVLRYVVEQKGEIHDVWQLTMHPIPHTPWYIGYFPKGPKPDAYMLQELQKIGKKHNAIFIQIEPNEIKIKDQRSKIKDLISSHHPLFTKYTFVLDLTKSEDDLLKSMHNKTRYNIKVAQKHGVEVKEDTSEKAFREYLKLSEETTERQGFYAHNRAYHETLWHTLKDTGMLHLWTATYKGETLASWMLFTWNDTIYYPYGASSRNHREVMAPNVLLWEIAKWGKKEGYKAFDLWGALGPSPTGEPDPDDPWYGFHRFKQGYNPTLVEFIGSYDLVIQPFLYTLYCLADTIRWSVLKMKAKV